MDAALTAHNALLRSLVRAWGGYEFGYEGDAFFVAFTNAPDALNCAMALQASLMHVQVRGRPARRASGHAWRGHGGLHTRPANAASSFPCVLGPRASL